MFKDSLLKINKFQNYLAGKSFLYILFLGILPALILFYLFYSILLDQNLILLENKRKLVLQKELEVSKGLEVEKSEDLFKQQFKEVLSLFETSLTKVPREVEISSIIASLQDLGKRHNVKVTSLISTANSIKSPNGDKLYEREVPVSVVGNYDDILRFWNDISNSDRILLIRDFQVETPKDGNKTFRPKLVSGNFTVLVFNAPPTNEFPTLPTGIFNQFNNTASMPKEK